MRRAGLRLVLALAALGAPAAALAQTGDEARHRTSVIPYIEAAQVLTQELEPGNDTVTYTSLAAGVDATVAGRNSAASVSLRYERRFGWGRNQLDGDTLSGIARAGVQVMSGVTMEAGALAARTRVEGNGAASLGGFAGNDDSTSQIYSVYTGPSVRTMAGDVEVEGHYRIGYTRVEAPDAVFVSPGAAPADFFDDSTTHVAYARAGVRPGVVAPVGFGVGGDWTQQDISNLDQRVRDAHIRADVTVPVSPTVALVGGVGYEDLEVSSRDALRDVSGNPVIGSDGRYATDRSAPRRIAYQTDGLIWDAGVLWRPSRRTSLEAHVGRRYGATTYYGAFAYASNSRSSYNLAVYDSVTAFGGVLVDRLAGLPTQFDAFRNPISGQIGGCVASLDGGSCIAGALGSIRSAVFRSRGIGATYSADLGRAQFGVGVGYDRRRFIAAAGTVLAAADGVVDETVWLAAYAGSRLDARSTLSANLGANWHQSGFAPAYDTLGYSASLAYQRDLIRGLSATAAVGLDGISRENLPDLMSVSALLGLRYSFL